MHSVSMENRPYQKTSLKPSPTLLLRLEDFEMSKRKRNDQKGGSTMPATTFNDVEGPRNIDWKNPSYFRSPGDWDGADKGFFKFSDFTMKLDYCDMKHSWLTFLRQDISRYPNSKKQDSGYYFEWTIPELKETNDYIKEFLDMIESTEVGSEPVWLTKSDVGFKTDFHDEEFWSDENLVRSSSSGRVKIRPMKTNGAVAMVFWSSVSQHTSEKYQGWMGPMIKMFIGELEEFYVANKKVLDIIRKQPQKEPKRQKPDDSGSEEDDNSN